MNYRILLLALVIVAIAASPVTGQSPWETRIAVKLTIVNSAAVWGDGGGAYQDGQSGVIAYINNTGLWERDAIVTLEAPAYFRDAVR